MIKNKIMTTQQEELEEILKKMIQEIAENRKEINEMKEFITHLINVNKL